MLTNESSSRDKCKQCGEPRDSLIHAIRHGMGFRLGSDTSAKVFDGTLKPHRFVSEDQGDD